MYNIPLFDLNYDEREIKAVTEVIKSKWVSSGPQCMELEKLFCDFLGVKYAYATSNCTSALHLAVKVAGITEGDEVIVPSLTFVATANAVKYEGATPVFCDITGVDDLTMSPVHMRELLTPRTKAVIVMHYAGFSCDMEAIMRFARENNLLVIEDACHGPLSEYKGKKLGAIGDVGCFSFFSNKNLSTGEGGMIVTDHDNLAGRIKLLRSHGMTAMSYDRAKGHAVSYDVKELGYNYRMDDIRAALGIEQFKKLPEDLEKRKVIRDQYITRLDSCGKIIIPFCANSEYVSNYIFPIVLKDSCVEERDSVREKLQREGVQTSVHYPAVHRFQIYREEKEVTLPNTEYVTDCEITLPMYGNLSVEEVDYVCDKLLETLK